jgi:di/tricarboxylate transporter
MAVARHQQRRDGRHHGADCGERAAGRRREPIHIYIIIAASHCGFMLPSSAGSSALAAGYGVNLRTMFVTGLGAPIVCLVVIIIVGLLSMRIWPAFSTA